MQLTFKFDFESIFELHYSECVRVCVVILDMIVITY